MYKASLYKSARVFGGVIAGIAALIIAVMLWRWNEVSLQLRAEGGIWTALAIAIVIGAVGLLVAGGLTERIVGDLKKGSKKP